MEIESFIEARLTKLENTIRFNQVNMNGVDVGGELRKDAEATRKLLVIATRLEGFANGTDEAFGALQYVSEMRRAIAARWSGHKDYKKEWMS